MAHNSGMAINIPADGPYKTRFQGGMWPIFKFGELANLRSGRTEKEALVTCADWNEKYAEAQKSTLELKKWNN